MTFFRLIVDGNVGPNIYLSHFTSFDDFVYIIGKKIRKDEICSVSYYVPFLCTYRIVNIENTKDLKKYFSRLENLHDDDLHVSTINNISSILNF